MRLAALLAKYSIAGAVNGLVAYAVIFGCMATGLSPTLSNVLGYLVGLITSFLQSRHWVFRSKNHAFGDGLRFLVMFLIAFSANLSALQLLLYIGTGRYQAQLVATSIYVGVSFVLSSKYVFRKRSG